MSWLATDLDVNFLNEQVFDYLYGGYPITNSNLIAPSLKDPVMLNDLKKYNKYLKFALKSFPKWEQKNMAKALDRLEEGLS